MSCIFSILYLLPCTIYLLTLIFYFEKCYVAHDKPIQNEISLFLIAFIPFINILFILFFLIKIATNKVSDNTKQKITLS